jgi:hypothetical protein
VAEIYLSKDHGPSVLRRLGFLVNVVDEDAHPLIPGTMRVDCAAMLPGRLDLDAFDACAYRVIFIDPSDH